MGPFERGVATDHTIADGDTIFRIAARHGFATWEPIWEHPANKDLRRRRGSPQVLEPGDVLHVPDPRPGTVSCSTDQAHVFRKRTPEVFFCAYLRDHAGRPYAGNDYELVVGMRTFAGKTGPDGKVSHTVPVDAQIGRLTLQRSADPEDACVWVVEIGHIRPVEEIAGVQARLNNLGYKAGDVTGEMNDQTREALRVLQQHLGHDNPSGELDDATLDALRNHQHGL